MYNEDQPKNKNAKNKRHQIYPGKPSWGRKPSNFFSIDSIDNVYNANTMPESKTLDAKSNPSAKP
jgi:hypothetical protein